MNATRPPLLPIFLAATLAALLPPTAAAAQTPDFRAEITGQFEAAARKIVALAEAMPAESYGWSPMEGTMSVAHMYMHVASYNYMYPHLNLGIEPPGALAARGDDVVGTLFDYESLEDEVTTKNQALPILVASMDHVRKVIAGMSDADLAAPTELYGRDVASWAVLLQLVTHMNEHLGQAIAYARMNRVVPPWSR